jgi:hypothetical protein
MKAYKASKVKKVIVYEEAEPEKIDEKTLTKEQRINLIRYGPDSIMNKPKRIPINLLAKYRPMINLNEYKTLIQNLDAEAKLAEKLINFERGNEFDENLTADEQAQIRNNFV